MAGAVTGAACGANINSPSTSTHAVLGQPKGTPLVLGQPAPAGAYLSGLPATVLLNLVLTWPVYASVRRLLPPADVLDRVHEVRLLG